MPFLKEKNEEEGSRNVCFPIAKILNFSKSAQWHRRTLQEQMYGEIG